MNTMNRSIYFFWSLLGLVLANITVVRANVTMENRILLSKVQDVAKSNRTHEVAELLNIKKICLPDIDKASVYFSNYAAALQGNDDSIADENLNALSELRTKLYEQKDFCFDSVIRMLTFWGLRASDTSDTPAISGVGLFYLRAQIDVGPVVNWLTPGLREQQNWCTSFSRAGSLRFSLMGAYDCKTQRIFIDPFSSPFDLSAVLIHEISHFFTDGQSRRAPDEKVSTQNMTTWDEFSATLGAGYLQARLRAIDVAKLSLPSLPTQKTSSAGIGFGSTNLKRYFKGYTLARDHFETDRDFSLFNFGGRLTGWMYDHFSVLSSFDSAFSRSIYPRVALRRGRDGRFNKGFVSAMDRVDKIYFGSKRVDTGTLVNEILGLAPMMVQDTGFVPRFFHSNFVFMVPMTLIENSMRVLWPFLSKTPFRFDVGKGPSAYCRAFLKRSGAGEVYKGLNLKSKGCNFDKHLNYPLAAVNEDFLENLSAPSGSIRPGVEGVKVCIHPGKM